MSIADGVVRLHWSARVVSQFDRLAPQQIADAVRKLAGQGRRAKALLLLEQAFVEHPRDPHLVAVHAQLAPRPEEARAGPDPASRVRSIRALLATAAAHLPRPERIAWVYDGSLGLELLRGDGVTDLLRFDVAEDRRAGRVYDLTLCLEYAQRVAPGSSDALVRWLCERSLRVVFSAALPRQPGPSHINCRSQHDWIELFEACGFACLDAFRPVLWQAPHVEPAIRQNSFLMVRRDLRGEHARLREPSLLDVYHHLLVNAQGPLVALPAGARGRVLQMHLPQRRSRTDLG